MENGEFFARNALFWSEGKWGFFDSEALFSRFCCFGPLYRAEGFANLKEITSRLFGGARELPSQTYSSGPDPLRTPPPNPDSDLILARLWETDFFTVTGADVPGAQHR